MNNTSPDNRQLPKILIVDDDDHHLAVSERILASLDIEIFKASSGRSAVSLAKSHEFSLIILDVQMPGIDGYETAELIRFFGKSQKSPIIFLTAHAIKEKQIFKGYHVGAVDYLQKPFPSEILQSKATIFVELFQQKELINHQKEYLEEVLNEKEIILEEIQQANLRIKEQNQKLEAASQQMDRELEQARLAQLALLPTDIPDFPNLDLAINYQPMAQIGGDFYDLKYNGNEIVDIIIGDVTGHGIPAALLSFLFMTALRNTHDFALTPDAIIGKLNKTLVGKLPAGKYATLFFCDYNIKTRVLSYTCAGHPAGFLLRQGSDRVDYLETSGTVVGMFDPPILSFETQTVNLAPGDKVIICTDGILEATDDNKKMLDAAELEKLMLTHIQDPIAQLLYSVHGFCLDFSGDHGIEDDVTILGFEVIK